MWVPGRTFYFKIQVQKYTRLSFDANFIAISLSLYINVGHILEFIFTCLFSPFFWLNWFGW